MEQVMKKRISALLMALMLAVGMLSGCDNTCINSSDSGKTRTIDYDNFFFIPLAMIATIVTNNRM